MTQSLYVAKADADKNTAEFQRMKKIADKADLPLIHVSEADYTLTRSQARNRAAFTKADEAARAIGQQVRIVPDNQTETQASPALASRQHLSTKDTMYVTKDAMRNRATFLRLEAEAKREYKTLKPIASWDALPDAERQELEALVSEA